MPELVLYVRATPLQVAAALRRHFAMRGFDVAPPGSNEPAAMHFRIGAGPLVPITAAPIDSVDELLAATLSQVLRTRAVTVVDGERIAAVKRWEQGRLVEQAGVMGGQVVDGQGSELAGRLEAGELTAVLDELGIERGAEVRRAVDLSFVQRGGRGATDLVVDPALSCPRCGGPMASKKGRFGDFWGCLRYPSCDGKLNATQATALRNLRR